MLKQIFIFLFFSIMALDCFSLSPRSFPIDEKELLRGQLFSVPPDDLGDAVFEIQLGNELDFITQRSEKLLKIIQDTPFKRIMWHNTRLSNFSGIGEDGIQQRVDGKIFYLYLNLEDGTSHLYVLTELARATLRDEDTYGYTSGYRDHGVVIFPAHLLGRSLGDSVRIFNSESTDPTVDPKEYHYVDLRVPESELAELVQGYVKVHGDIRYSEEEYLKILYLKGLWLDRVSRYFKELFASDTPGVIGNPTLTSS